MNRYFATLSLALLLAAGQSALAQDDTACLDCHEPAADWMGMSVDEIMEIARDPDIKRHKENLEMAEDDLRDLVKGMVEPQPMNP